MLDPEAELGASTDVPDVPDVPDGAADGVPQAPPTPTWTKTYEMPTARKVVSAGLQLAVEVSGAIRHASIYIGLLALGAFGPAVLLLLLGIGRLMSDPATAQTMATDPSLIFLEQPEIAGPLALIYFLVVVGIILLGAISIDAQAMAIAILGGRASDRPLRLWEAIVRARQVFWRLAGAGFLVGLASTIVTFVVTLPFIRPFDTNTGITFIGSMIGALVVTPFAFASAGIVLGDVGAVEALRRSMALFRERPRIALVVTLFTLVTSAIQTLAIGAGADIAVRVGELMHLGLDQGGIPLIVTAVIVLAFIVAFGSLTFTIAAIVAAPQVAGFLGLTYYSGGLDRARTPDGVRPRRFRWVSMPMLVAMIGLLVVAGFGLPSVSGFQPRPASQLLAFLRTAAGQHDQFVTSFGPPSVVEDRALDDLGSGGPSFDIVAAEYGYLPDVPAWLLSSMFDCDAENVACSVGAPAPGPTTFAKGAHIFVQRMVGPPGITAEGEYGEWGPVVALPGYDTAPAWSTEPFPNASHAVVTSVTGATRSVRYLQYADGGFTELPSRARSTWIGNDLFTIVPVVGEFSVDPESWDAYAHLNSNGIDASRDSLRSTNGGALLPFPGPPEYWLDPIDGAAP